MNAPPLAERGESKGRRESGEHVISVDEMTGIQALKHKYPDKLPLPGQCAKRKFEYIHHGTTSQIGFYDVAPVV